MSEAHSHSRLTTLKVEKKRKKKKKRKKRKNESHNLESESTRDANQRSTKYSSTNFTHGDTLDDEINRLVAEKWKRVLCSALRMWLTESIQVYTFTRPDGGHSLSCSLTLVLSFSFFVSLLPSFFLAPSHPFLLLSLILSFYRPICLSSCSLFLTFTECSFSR